MSSPATTHPAPLLEVAQISKQFPGIKALSQVSLSLNHGEVLAVIGENGAGKSTLMKILAGVQPPDSGKLLIEGAEVSISDVEAALEHGIALIHQELNLCENLDIAANIFLGREPASWNVINQQQTYVESEKLLKQVGLNLPPQTLVGDLTVGQQQMVEIAKALSINARILIMDEPTSSLSLHESEALFAVIRELKARGVSVIYISHRLGEVNDLADRVVVLRDGENAGDLDRASISHERMVQLMVGRNVSQFFPHTPHEPGQVVLEVKQLRTPAYPSHFINFSIRQNEIVGISGLVGAGRTELLQVLFGIDSPLSGSISVAGQEVQINSPRDAIRAGLALVPEDRKLQGLVLEMAVRENMSLASLTRDRKSLGRINFNQERNISEEMIAVMNIKTPSDSQIVQFLSGGNQQKVVLGKWLAMNPRVLLLDEPTRGVDIGAKEEIYTLMNQLASQGMAVLFVSSDLEEIRGISDRVLVMHEGQMTGELSRDEFSEEAIMQLATGQTFSHSQT
ncbi:sugar ABC transporter ATP-binding protein [Gimesia sp.]|uniref:sugar ABC transporter ATP-binding protein n=1 Tax=Gimesia sp. TaxID=2024833 RepID=UPI000C65E27F|nr:sugar ABC transporter ATP-binding protein [Gimesia sp.]MAX39736.1 D-xylose ABC transporter ATP-binding protein [Gimesia sp.]HBL47100.1 D-xylose ABC transporter ATP-binding protein [Planctomycetaceae bacterium]|tara:strand:- start:716 stop:2248 length:1533 start_codon:yes stop_codon:yes gene_type:complete